HRGPNRFGDLLRQQLRRRMTENRAPISRQPHTKAHFDRSVRTHGHARSLEHLLPRLEYEQLTTPSRPGPPTRKRLECRVQRAIQEIRGRHPARGIPGRPFRQRNGLRWHQRTHTTGVGERIALHMIDDEYEVGRTPGTGDRFVAPVRRTIEVVEDASELGEIGHGPGLVWPGSVALGGWQ